MAAHIPLHRYIIVMYNSHNQAHLSWHLYSWLLYDITFCHLILFFTFFTDLIGMTKECFELIFSEIKEKSQRMNMWKGSRKTKSGKIQDKYLKVIS